METEKLFNEIMHSSIFSIYGEDIELCEVLIALCEAIDAEHQQDEFFFDMGESLECTLGELIVGAYWSLTEWHAGQYTKSYAALSALGGIFSPGMGNGPEQGTGEQTAYRYISAHFDRGGR